MTSYMYNSPMCQKVLRRGPDDAVEDEWGLQSQNYGNGHFNTYSDTARAPMTFMLGGSLQDDIATVTLF